MSELTVAKDGDLTSLSINRPDKRNSLSASLVESLLEQLDIAADDGTRLLVLQGEGVNFSAGFDFTGYEDQSEGTLLQRFVRIEILLQALKHFPHATLALAHGRNFGAGADLFACCDHRIGTADSSYMFPGFSFGLVLGTRRLAACTSAGWAQRILESGATVGAREALEQGLLTGTAEQPEWVETIAAAAETARQLQAPSSRTLRRVLTPDTRDTDLADLVRSAGEPGLAERLRQYRERSKKK